MTMAPRRGFALLAVLWVIAGLSAIALGLTLAARQAVAAAHNRNDLTRAQWRAEECAEQARALIADSLAKGEWSGLDRVVERAGVRGSDCRVTLRAAGSRLDINRADSSMIAALLARLRIRRPRRDSVIAAILDWRDADDITRPLGAERDWYVSQGLIGPRNGPLADVRELRGVRGLAELPVLSSLVDVEPGPVALNSAPLDVIAALPGFGDEALSRLAELRSRGLRVNDLISFSALLSPGARDLLLSHYADLVGLTAVDPAAWILTSSATVGSPPVTEVLELRVVRGGQRAAIVRRRTWIE